MALTREELLHIAKVARIALTEEEINELLPQFNEILDLLERVRQMPLTDAAPIIMTDNADEFRPDVPLRKRLRGLGAEISHLLNTWRRK